MIEEAVPNDDKSKKHGIGDYKDELRRRSRCSKGMGFYFEVDVEKLFNVDGNQYKDTLMVNDKKMHTGKIPK